jgi:release factor glutamine methyltransferase
MKSALPIEYREGFAEFLGCKIDLSTRPLIPRPETEFWTRRAIIDLARLPQKNIAVLDLFSGSGCVGVAVAKNLLKATVDFADIDSKALEQIKINIKINGIDDNRTRVFESNVFGGIAKNAKYDAILANPPYVDPERINEVQKSVLDWELSVALFAENHGLAVIEKFLFEAKDYLTSAGFIYLEFDPRQKRDIMEIAGKSGYRKREFFKDQFGRWRFAKFSH